MKSQIILAVTSLSLVVASAVYAACCNNTTRQQDVPAGTTGVVTVTCPSFEITIAGQTLQVGEHTCIVSQTVRYDTLFKCEGQLNGTNCNPQGNKSNYDVQTGGGCWVPTTLEELQAQKICKDRTSNPSYDWSATTSPC